MKIGLIDVDSHNFPNLCLMKISAYHKSVGDDVEWYNGFSQYDMVHMERLTTHVIEYIEREAAKKAACDAVELFPSEYEAMEKAIDAIPATDVAPVVHGRWVKDNLLPTHCSVCGELPLRHRSGEYERLSPYCPNCGAKMDLEEQNGKT